MADILKFGQNAKKPPRKRNPAEPNALRVLWACALLGAVSISLIPFMAVYAVLYWTLPKASKADSKVLIMVVHNYLMDFLRSIESGKRISTNVDLPKDET